MLALALLSAWTLHLAGWGKPSGTRPAAQWDWRVRDVAAGAGHDELLLAAASQGEGRLVGASRNSPPRRP